MRRLNIQLLYSIQRKEIKRSGKRKYVLLCKISKKQNGRRGTGSLVLYLFKNVMLDELEGDEDRNVFSKYCGMKEITGCI